VLLRRKVVLNRADNVLVESDGTFAPLSIDAAATVYVEIDGRRVTNVSSIDWRGSAVPVRHSFNAVGAASLSRGSHTVALIAAPSTGAFTVSATSNLSIFVHPAQRVSAGELVGEAGPFDYTTYGRRGPDAPHAPLVSLTGNKRGPTIALGSASTRKAAHDGDAMLGIYLDHQHPGPDASLWSVNDTCTCAEAEGPLYTHALLTGRESSTVSLDAAEFPWDFGEDPAIFVVRPTATLVTLSGGMRIARRAPAIIPGFPDEAGTVWQFVCVGSDVAWPGCPPVAAHVLIAADRFRVARPGRDVVMFTAKTRVQADQADAGGTLTMWLTLDGRRVGSTAVQQLRAPFSVSERTLAASYLAAGGERLKSGWHTVRLFAQADGSFIHVTTVRDLPLLIFD
jgi:hypothetical protein